MGIDDDQRRAFSHNQARVGEHVSLGSSLRVIIFLLVWGLGSLLSVMFGSLVGASLSTGVGVSGVASSFFCWRFGPAASFASRPSGSEESFSAWAASTV